MKPQAVISDLDGTLCDISHRIEHFHARNWRDFFGLIPGDSPIRAVRNTLRALHAYGYEIIFVSARSEEYREATRWWLTEHCPGFEKFPLFLRGRYDERFDNEVKKEIYINQIEPKYRVEFVLEDRDHVVEMWRKLSLNCWQVAKGDY